MLNSVYSAIWKYVGHDAQTVQETFNKKIFPFIKTTLSVGVGFEEHDFHAYVRHFVSQAVEYLEGDLTSIPTAVVGNALGMQDQDVEIVSCLKVPVLKWGFS